ncbi:hypothetical protein HYS93_02545 [Candidatus Daviesbacteria bacterium]|nr:hypothetical protein [Candidatus Daviesbacteria bacterium]
MATAIDLERVRGLIGEVERNGQMPPSKQTLLLTNLRDQLNVPNNTFSLRQVTGSGIDHNQSQRFNPNLRSVFQPGFFSLRGATGGSAIVDFANDRFGGGTLGPNGFAQEEKLLLETNLVPLAGAFTNLSRDPLYLQALQTHEFVGQGRNIYGNSRLGSRGNTIDRVDISPSNVSQYLQRVDPARNVNLIAMAALNMRRKGWREYKHSNLTQMFDTAYKAFRTHAEKGGQEVHTGAWGAGTFGNSENLTCVLQVLAAQAAGIRLIYHGSQDAYESGIRYLRGKYIVGQSYNTVFDSLSDYMQRRHTGSQFWRPQ